MTEIVQKVSTVSNVTAIKKFFEADGRKVDMNEMKALSMEERHQLGEMCLAELEKRGIKV